MTEYLVVDGYNIINAWPELKKLKEENYEHARLKLVEILLNYQGFKNTGVIIVFDAHQVKGGVERREQHLKTEVVYTREGETADMFIERIVGELAGRARVYVATSDWIEQTMILQRGALRLSPRDLADEVKSTLAKNMESLKNRQERFGMMVQYLPDKVRETLDRWRKGEV